MERLELLTLLLLAVTFLGVEAWRQLRGRRGTVLRFLDEATLVPAVADRRLSVRLEGGELVDAVVSGCTACGARLAPGDTVVLLRHRSGFVATVPWFAARCDSSRKGRCHG